MTPQLLFIRKDRRLTPWIAGLMAIGLLGTGSMAYWHWMVRHQAAVLTRMTVQVEAAPLQVRINASGKVQPIQTVNLSPKTSGVLVDLLVKQGDRVKKGQVIAHMEYKSLRAESDHAEARSAQAEAQPATEQSGIIPQTSPKSKLKWRKLRQKWQKPRFTLS